MQRLLAVLVAFFVVAFLAVGLVFLQVAIIS
jgi:hypothetical protein